MSVLRSTTNHYRQQGSASIALNVSHLSQGAIQLLYSWLEIWLYRHCKGGWTIEADSDDNPYQPRTKCLSIRFDDMREAVFFKLSPEYMRVHH
jgi:hypothetical protein